MGIGEEGEPFMMRTTLRLVVLASRQAISLASALQRRARSQTRQQRPELRYEAADEGWPGGEGTNRGSVAVDHARLCSTGAP